MTRDAERPSGVYDWQGAIDRLEGGYAGNTLRSYRNDFATFAAWCAGRGLASIPASVGMVRAFVDAHSVSAAHYAPVITSIRRRGTMWRSASASARQLAMRRVHRVVQPPLVGTPGHGSGPDRLGAGQS